MTRVFRASASEETRAFGKTLAGHLVAPCVILIHGPLGAGKTTLIQGIAQGLGISEPVLSPTFALAHEYRGGRSPLFHLDLYRLTGPDEVWEAGLAEYLDAEGVTAVEWPDRLGALTPSAYLEIEIRIEDAQARTIRVEGHGPAAERTAQELGSAPW